MQGLKSCLLALLVAQAAGVEIWSQSTGRSLRVGRIGNIDYHVGSAAGTAADARNENASSGDSAVGVISRRCLIVGVAVVIFLVALLVAIFFMRAFCVRPRASSNSSSLGVKLLSDKGEQWEIKNAATSCVASTHIPTKLLMGREVVTVSVSRSSQSSQPGHCLAQPPSQPSQCVGDLSTPQSPAAEAHEEEADESPEADKEEWDDEVSPLRKNSQFNLASDDSPCTSPRGAGTQKGTRRRARKSLSHWWDGADISASEDKEEEFDITEEDSPCTSPQHQAEKQGDTLGKKKTRLSLSHWWGAGDSKLCDSPNPPSSLLESASPLRPRSPTKQMIGMPYRTP